MQKEGYKWLWRGRLGTKGMDECGEGYGGYRGGKLGYKGCSGLWRG